jgi:hypothetical protein
MAKQRSYIVKAVVLVFLVSVIIVALVGPGRRIRHTVANRLPLDLNRAGELALDNDGDGEPDEWRLIIRESRPYECFYVARDGDYDGRVDSFGGMIANRTVWGLLDDDKDGRFDRQVVALGDVSDKNPRYKYQDLDFDGRFDAMLQMDRERAPTPYLFMNETFVRALPIATRDRREAWIEGPAGDEVKVTLQDGKWRSAEK